MAKKLLAVMWMALDAEPQAAGDAGDAHDGVEQYGDEGGGEQPRQHEPVERIDAHDLHRTDFVPDPPRPEVGAHGRPAGAGNQQRSRHRRLLAHDCQHHGGAEL